MRAVVLAEQGGSPTLTELPTPEAGAGEVLVRVQASSLNGFDVSVVAGRLAGMMEHRFPVVLGMDFAGTVAAVGESATRFAVGDPVFGVMAKEFLGDGGFGEYVVVGEQHGVTVRPDDVDVAAAGALGVAGTAAVDALDAVAPQAGETVLISGATGGVGAIAIQYATAAGAKVIATARPGAETDFVRGLGATDVVDHTGDLAAQVRAISPAGVDAVLHLAGDTGVLTGLLTDKGRLAGTRGLGPDQHPAAVAIMASPTVATLDRLATDVAAGRITVPVTRTYALAEVPAAFADFAAGTIGKLAVTVA
ncbi:NADPH:quinone reductase-like Zn-dependent oxidoreductase [Nonomuraea polychroma]|uniref:NADPH:quinone reductase-like Zn-dependent oxidoreductase n=1 Tax=Nonomuraea polychroma TaxID=46176 RepID=A0A438M6M0_9ACTN|nr:NADP-dependent oxidoreductase [Nonomuraea polychroma]RVX41337.1 NADPH:quinone reductase-like Zn-dependent oxidoreductase [Nonomuraea polychroma]